MSIAPHHINLILFGGAATDDRPRTHPGKPHIAGGDCRDVGYQSDTAFNRSYQRQFGVAPSLDRWQLDPFLRFGISSCESLGELRLGPRQNCRTPATTHRLRRYTRNVYTILMTQIHKSAAERTNIVLDSMLVDSSVWIAYLRGDDLVVVERLAEALDLGEPVWASPPILQEVLQGADSPDRFRRWDRLLGELPMIIAPDARCQRRTETAQLWRLKIAHL